MKCFLVAAAFAAALAAAAPASAADLTETPVAASYDWSGFYIGANGGWGSSHSCWDAQLAGLSFSEGCHNATGGTVGAQLGYRWQRNDWVFGLEAQGNWADLKGSNVSEFIPPFIDRSRVDWFGLLTAQVGYSVDNALFYVKGGAAVTHDRFEVLFPPDIPAGKTGDQTRWGGALGAGLEYGFAPNWSLAIEYDHLFMPDKTTAFAAVGLPFPFGTDRIGQDVDLVGLRLNFHWNG
ncbi:porin family protein [Mesorhizobium sp. B3-1-3]|nr:MULTISPECIES: outer membrane beta-barrel protein [unclassified Mesorhizobium]TPI62564.1 porin family protein [Mesorhizobium sp. B3-1-8]TPI74134.1 porin family protein [Mesorhizobium sp. B3-1-3]